MTKTHDLIEKSVTYRGLILQNSIHLERVLDSFIVHYFSDDDQKQLDIFVFLVDRLSFDSKISVFQAILQRDNPSDYKKKFDKLMGKLRQAKDERNIFAHYSLKTDWHAVRAFDKNVTYMFFRNKVDYKEYTDKRIMEILGIIDHCTIEIKKLIK